MFLRGSLYKERPAAAMKITVKALDAGNAEFDLPEEVSTRVHNFRGWFTAPWAKMAAFDTYVVSRLHRSLSKN